MGELFQVDESTMVETLMNEFRSGQNWTEKMAGQDRKEGLVMDEAIYNSHIENENFYNTVSEMITERIKNREVSNEKKEHKKNKLFKFMSGIINKIKNTIKRKDVKMLPEATQDIKKESRVNPNTRNEFLENIKVSPEELAENIENQQIENVQIKEDNKEGPNLDDLHIF